MENFSLYDEFKMNTVNNTAMADVFLSRKADGYRVQLLGKNGEPHARKSINVTLRRREILREGPSTTKTKLVRLMTDTQGLIYLGNLEDV